MTRRKVLVIQSIDDETTAGVEYFSRSPRFEKYEIEVFYAVHQDEIAMEHKDNQTYIYAVPYEDLLRRLDERISAFEPDMLTIHIGIAFMTKPESFLQALAVIKERHPSIELRYERIGWPQEDGPRDRSIGYNTCNIPIKWLLDENSLFDGEDEEIFR
jgi:hypothetical protein